LGQYLVAKRREMGWSIKEAARTVGIDPGTWRNWEGGKTILYRQHRSRIAQLLGPSPDALNQEIELFGLTS
jgi:transcriptional regulator with XRE-family HTH domain